MIDKLREWWSEVCWDLQGMYEMIGTSIIVIAVLAIIVWGTFAFTYKISEPLREAYTECLDAGYSEVQCSANGYYCVGIRDGNTVTILVDELETGE